jgi:hypothetical protein
MSGIFSTVTDIGEGHVNKEGAEQGGQLAQLTHEFNAQIDETNAFFVDATTRLNVAEARRQGVREKSQQQAAIGATGLTSESFDAVSQESALEVERDILAIELQGAIEAFNLRQSAFIERSAGEAAKFGASVSANAAARRAQGGVARGLGSAVSFFS